MQLSRGTFLLLLLAIAPAACSEGASDASGSGGEGGTTLAGTPCSFGNDPSQCGGDDAFACTPQLADTGEDCDEDEDCGLGELCFVAAGDSPAGICRSIEGTCSPVPPLGPGLDFGEACDPGATQDPCAGECVPIGAGEAGECEQTCRVGAESGCGQDPIEGSSVACAFYAYDLSDAGIEQGAGDLGVCAHLCNCNANCPGEQLCLSAPASGYSGICAGGIDSEDSVPVCANGAGGAGGGPG